MKSTINEKASCTRNRVQVQVLKYYKARKYRYLAPQDILLNRVPGSAHKHYVAKRRPSLPAKRTLDRHLGTPTRPANESPAKNPRRFLSLVLRHLPKGRVAAISCSTHRRAVMMGIRSRRPTVVISAVAETRTRQMTNGFFKPTSTETMFDV